MTTRSVLQPGQLEAAAGPIVEIHLPAEDVFLRRSRRFEHLAAHHTLQSYLLFLAQVTRWQHNELQRSTELPAVDAHTAAQCQKLQIPPLAPTRWPRHPSWCAAVNRLIRATSRHLPEKGKDALAMLEARDTHWMEEQASFLLHNPENDSLDPAAAPFIGAVLQVHWTYWAQSLRGMEPASSGHSAHCPLCGSPPVSAVVHAGGASSGLRYLQCSLCSSQWHVVRAKCSRCENTRDIGYYGLEKTHEAVRIEMCPACRSSLKVLFRKKDAAVDAAMTETVEHRPIGINFFML